MVRFNYIVEDNNEPAIQNIWLTDNDLKYWTDSGWKGLIPKTMSWTAITEKPSTFPPSSHTHTISDVSNLQSSLDNKAPRAHNHTHAAITDWNTELDKKANVSHTHAVADISGLSTVATSGSYNDLSNKPDIPAAYTLPDASTSTRGGVLMASAVTNLAGTEDTAAICSKVNSLLATLRTAGILQS